MGDTTITIVAIFLAAILMFVFPLMSMADRNDDIAQMTVQTTTTDFVDKIRTTGKLSLAQYNSYVTTLSSTGNSYDVELQFNILDENVGKKTIQANATKIGENVYYSIYTTQIIETLNSKYAGLLSTNTSEQAEELATYTLKEGDMVSVSIKNKSLTISQVLKNFYYKITGSDTYVITAEHSGIVSVNG